MDRRRQAYTVGHKGDHPVPPVHICSCKRSHCLKLYCECFSQGKLCAVTCKCVSCCNNVAHVEQRNAAVEQLIARNPVAFRPKVVAAPASAAAASAGSPPTTGTGHSSGQLTSPVLAHQRQQQLGGAAGLPREFLQHQRGCNCKRSRCLLKYCECFQANTYCTTKCKCVECKNYFGSAERLKVSVPLTDSAAAAMSPVPVREGQGGGPTAAYSPTALAGRAGTAPLERATVSHVSTSLAADTGELPSEYLQPGSTAATARTTAVPGVAATVPEEHSAHTLALALAQAQVHASGNAAETAAVHDVLQSFARTVEQERGQAMAQLQGSTPLDTMLSDAAVADLCNRLLRVAGRERSLSAGTETLSKHSGDNGNDDDVGKIAHDGTVDLAETTQPRKRVRATLSDQAAAASPVFSEPPDDHDDDEMDMLLCAEDSDLDGLGVTASQDSQPESVASYASSTLKPSTTSAVLQAFAVALRDVVLSLSTAQTQQRQHQVHPLPRDNQELSQKQKEAVVEADAQAETEQQEEEKQEEEEQQQQQRKRQAQQTSSYAT